MLNTSEGHSVNKKKSLIFKILQGSQMFLVYIAYINFTCKSLS